MMRERLSPSRISERLGLLDAYPRALARHSGALRLLRAALSQEPAPVAPTPHRVVHRIGSARLLRYTGAGAPRHGRPLLICPSLINRPYILDLQAGVSVIAMLVGEGHDVFVIDWGDPGPEERGLGFDDFTSGRLRAFLDVTCALAGSEQAHVLGHCLGGTMTTALAAVDDARIASLINLTVPFDFHDAGMLSAWARAPYLDVQALAEALGHIPSWLTQPAFLVLRPLGTPVKALRLYQNLGNEKFLAFFRCLETWINDNVAIPDAFFVDLIERCYRDNAFVSGSLRLGGAPVRLENVRVPVLTVCAEQDHIVSPRAALLGHERYGSAHKRAEVFPGGHIGVVVGGLSRRNLWPMLTSWLEEHEVKARSVDAHVDTAPDLATAPRAPRPRGRTRRTQESA